MLSKQNYMRARVLFHAVRDKEQHAGFLFENCDAFPAMAMNILNMIDGESEWFGGYVDALAYRRRSHPLYDSYHEQINNHLMYLYLQERVRRLFYSIVCIKLFVRRRACRFLEWFYDPDTGPFMKRKAVTWRLNDE